jgi:hypothetical protein
MRSFNSPEAFSVKVNATMLAGFTPAALFDWRISTIRRDITCVLPEPAQAMI